MIPATLTPASPAPRPLKLQSLWPRRLPVIMGILNCTPDSFSDGGLFGSSAEAVAHGITMAEEGADIIDVGGESTRPGSRPVSATDETERVVPVIRELKRRLPETMVSIDTSKAHVAEAALEAGADLVNDVSAGADIQMIPTVEAHGAGIVLMHMRGHPRVMQTDTAYINAPAEVHAYLSLKARQAVEAGIPKDLVWLDPGIGFGKDDLANVQLVAGLSDLAALGYPVVVGVSRKSMIGRLTGAGVDDRLPGSLAALTPTIGLPRVIVRVHEPRPTRQFLEMLATIDEARR